MVDGGGGGGGGNVLREDSESMEVLVLVPCGVIDVLLSTNSKFGPVDQMVLRGQSRLCNPVPGVCKINGG